MSEFLKIAIEAAQTAGELIKQDYSFEKTINYKDPRSIVTKTDTDAETAIINTITNYFPDHAFFGEESGDSGNANSEYIWVIDPIDGTTNFTRQLGHVSVSIALLKNNQPQVGVVFNPLNNNLFAANTGHGATLNNQPISPSQTNDLAQAVVGLGRSPVNNRDGLTELMSAISPAARTIRVLGSHALQVCQVASGQLDAYLATDTNYYDIAAASLIASEAGAAIMDFTTKEWLPDPHGSYDILASNANLNPIIQSLLT